MTPLVEVRDLVVQYGRRGPPAVDHVSFEIGAGQAVGIVGESGSGKSSTARALLGLVRPRAGTVNWEGRPVSRSRRDPARRAMAAVFQDPSGSLDPMARLRDTITEPRWARERLSRAARAELAAELAALVALAPSVLGQRPRELSGGQQQRAAIARALCGSPRLLVLDEPVSALDVSTQAGVLRLLDRLRDGQGLTLLLISHDLGVVASLCEHVIVMRHGRVVDQGSAAELLEAPSHPYTAELVAAMPVLTGPAALDTPATSPAGPDGPALPEEVS